jgi:hypothetical protein
MVTGGYLGKLEMEGMALFRIGWEMQETRKDPHRLLFRRCQLRARVRVLDAAEFTFFVPALLLFPSFSFLLVLRHRCLLEVWD